MRVFGYHDLVRLYDECVPYIQNKIRSYQNIRVHPKFLYTQNSGQEKSEEEIASAVQGLICKDHDTGFSYGG